MLSLLHSVVAFVQGDGLTILPEMELLLFALGILIFDLFLEQQDKYWNAVLALVGAGSSAMALYKQYQRYSIESSNPIGQQALFGFHNCVIVDGFSLIFGCVFLAGTAIVLLLSVRYLDQEQAQDGEYYALLLLTCVGMMFMASGIDLIVMLLGLEIMALSLYVLTGLLNANKRSNEAALKYLLLGAFSTAILAYGFSLLYGVSASTNIAVIGNLLDQRLQYTSANGLVDWLVILAFVTIAAGLFFRIAAVPFHQWAPDVYEGAPTPVSAHISVASTTAGFALLLRLTTAVFGGSQATWVYIIAGVAVASLTWGTLAALTQANIKRLLAYSSISHAGYILLGLVAGNRTGFTGMVFYLIAYASMTLGVFAVVIVMRQRNLIGDELADLDGLYCRSPAAGVLLLIFVLSLAGIPPTAGFMAKYLIFQALIEAHHPVLAVIAALYTVPALYYYFRIVAHAWLKKLGDAPAPVMSNAQAIALGAAVFVSLAAGLYPEPFTRLARYAFGP
jgi:NADH-quinone oxidoreductase subunit N